MKIINFDKTAGPSVRHRRDLRQNKIQKGAPAPLFDRLQDDDLQRPIDTEEKAYLDEEGLIASIQREINRILDSRLGSESDLSANNDGIAYLLPEEFGMRDYGSLSSRTDSDYDLILSSIRTAIERFEPRLHNPRVALVSLTKENSGIEITISGDVDIYQQRRPVRFPMTVKNLFNR